MRLGFRPSLLLLLPLLFGAEPCLAEYRLGGPKVMKLAWNTRSLVAQDIDGDGRVDLAVLNNDRARIELLYQRRPGEKPQERRMTGLDRWQPVLDDAPFRRQSLATGIRMFALALGDLNGDGLVDLAYTGNPDGLSLRYQSPRGVFTQKRVFEIEAPTSWIDTLTIADLDRDGRNDLAMLTEGGLLVFSQNSDGELEGPVSHAVADEDCYGLKAVDADADGRLDLVYQVAQNPDALRIRFGLASGGFGPEQGFRIEATRGVMAVLDGPGSPRPSFARIQATTGLLELLALDRDGNRGSWLEGVRPRLFSSRTDPKVPASYALDDFDGDGRLDIAVADGRGARTWLLLQTGRGEYAEAVEFPSLADVRSLASGDRDGDGRAELFLASPKDRAVAWTTLGEEGRMAYPRPLPTRGKPFAVAAGDLDGNGSLEVVSTFEDQRERGVSVLTPVDGGNGWRETTIMLEDFDSAPRALRIVDANGDARQDLAVFGAHEGLRLLLQLPDGSFSQASVSSGFRKGLVDGIEAPAFTTGDVNGDGRREMLVASEGYARSLTVAADGNLEVVDQYNARTNDTRIAAALVADIDRSSVPEIVLVEKGGGRLQVLRRRRGGVYRHVETAAIGAIDLVEGRVVDLAGDGSPDILLLGADRFLWLPLGSDDEDMVSLSNYESDLENVGYHMLAVGDLDADGRHDIVAVDTRDTRILEVLSLDDRQRWHSELHFTVFDADPHYEGQRGNASEPREIVLADLTGDGRDDIALLIHDRILIYPQE
jgi:hypothetical protein